MPYTEEIYHPALLVPRTTRGEMELAQNGDLVRRQAWPTVEESRIGENFLTVIKNEESNLLPIPDDLKPWLTTLRLIVTGGQLPPDIKFDYAIEKNVWRIAHLPNGSTGEEISLVGCGSELQQIELAQPDKTRRVLVFQTQ